MGRRHSNTNSDGLSTVTHCKLRTAKLTKSPETKEREITGLTEPVARPPGRLSPGVYTSCHFHDRYPATPIATAILIARHVVRSHDTGRHIGTDLPVGESTGDFALFDPPWLRRRYRD